MSTIRFLHSDHFRLGTPLAGIADSPGWLQQLACHSVRQSVRNVIEAAVAQQVQFLVIAGQVTESAEDLESAIHWLSGQFETLQKHGIRVVARAQTPREEALLDRLCDVVIRDGECLHVSPEANGTLGYSVNRGVESSRDGLLLTFGRHPRSTARTEYNASPALQSSADCDRHAGDGYLSLSAGAVQAVRPAETWEFGCILVEADVANRELRSEFLVSDVLRYATEELSLTSPATVESLINGIARASDVIGQASIQTVVVDWRINAQLVSELSEVSGLVERELLLRLRGDLQSGHRGVWPRRLTFGKSCSLQLSSPTSEAVEEYVNVAGGPVSAFHVGQGTDPQLVLRGGVGIESSLVSGLHFLSHVA